MTTNATGGGDPARSLEVLWRTRAPAGRGPRPALDVDHVVRAAIDLADQGGLAALSMSKVAKRLGVGTMSLYTYVPGKAELLDAMVDLVSAEAVGEDRTGGWRSRLEQIAVANWELYKRHAWLLDLGTTRPPLGPNVTAKYDHELRAVDGIGLSDVEMDTVLNVVIGHAETAARRSVQTERLAQDTSTSDEQWWQANAPLLAQLFDAERFPLAVRVGTAAGQQFNAASDPEFAFTFGLHRLLDGIDTLITARRHTG